MKLALWLEHLLLIVLLELVNVLLLNILCCKAKNRSLQDGFEYDSMTTKGASVYVVAGKKRPLQSPKQKQNQKRLRPQLLRSCPSFWQIVRNLRRKKRKKWRPWERATQKVEELGYVLSRNFIVSDKLGDHNTVRALDYRSTALPIDPAHGSWLIPKFISLA